MPPGWRLSEVSQQLPETDQPATDFVLDGDVELRRRQVGAERPAYLRGTQRSSAGAAAAVVLEQFAQCHTEGFFHQAGAAQVARKLEGQGAA